MAQTVWIGSAMVHPSGVIEATGETDVGRTLKIFLGDASTDLLRAAFIFENKHGVSLGHAFWHAQNDKPEPCESCKFDALTDKHAEADMKRFEKEA